LPILNAGTVVENIALVEAARLVFEEPSNINEPVEFVNSFAMSPFTPWRGPGDYLLNGGLILANVQKPGSDRTHAGLFATCCAPNMDQGPSGALLVGLLAQRLGAPVRYWLNDLSSDPHYPHTMAGLQAFDSTLAGLAPLGLPPAALVTCGIAYPQSMSSSLQPTLRSWSEGGSARRRLGYLDPNRYRLAGANGPETSSVDHRLWLETLRSGDPQFAVSVHFTAHNNWPSLRPEVAGLQCDATDAGYSSVTCRHSYFHTVVSLFHHDVLKAAELRVTLRTRILATWQRWCGHTPRAFEIT
jgi:hypothetical protein